MKPRTLNRAGSIAAALAISATAAGAGSLTVTNTTDVVDGSCDATCSLRDAIADSVAGDTIVFDFGPKSSPPWTIRLTAGQISINHELTIEGPTNATELAISGDSDSNGTGNFRVFLVTASGDLTLSDLTVRDGATTTHTDKDGACARVSGRLELDSVLFTNCRAWNGGTAVMNNSAGGEGGAIYVVAGATLVATDSSFTSNLAGQGEIRNDFMGGGPGGRGGAIATAGTTTIRRSTFSSNAAGKGAQPNGHGGAGGAVAVLPGGNLLLEDSTLASNRSGDGNDLGFVEGFDGAGGALALESDATLNNVTFSGNVIGTSATSGQFAVGGAIAVAGGTTRLRNVTIADNVSNGAGGGVARSGGTVILRNSIVANNTSSGTTSENCTTNAAGSFQSEGFNLLSVSTGCATSLVGTDQVGVANLGAFGSYGGPTSTYSLTSLSPALDGGDPAGCEAWDPSIPGDVPLAADQRGEPRPIDGDGDLTATCDAGAFEAPEPPKFELTVAVEGSGAGSVTSDPAGIDCPGDCSEEYFGTQQVELAPDADAGSVFTGWSGDCTGSGACAPTMSTARSVTATFALLRSLTVTLAGDGGGTVTSDPDGIDCGLDCDHQYADGASVGLTAEPDVLSLFAGWSGDCTGASCELTMSAARSVTATFIPLLIFESDFESAFDGWSDVVGE